MNMLWEFVATCRYDVNEVWSDVNITWDDGTYPRWNMTRFCVNKIILIGMSNGRLSSGKSGVIYSWRSLICQACVEFAKVVLVLHFVSELGSRIHYFIGCSGLWKWLCDLYLLEEKKMRATGLWVRIPACSWNSLWVSVFCASTVLFICELHKLPGF